MTEYIVHDADGIISRHRTEDGAVAARREAERQHPEAYADGNNTVMISTREQYGDDRAVEAEELQD